MLDARTDKFNNMTNRKKDLFDLFREQQHQLDASPSPRAWRNLERRLGSHRRRNRLSIVRNLSMAAALLLIAVVAVVFTFSVDGEHENRINQSPIAAESLQTDQVRAAEEIRLAVSAQRAEQQRRSSIMEGGRHQQLIPANLAGQYAKNAAPRLSAASWLLGTWQGAVGKGMVTAHWAQKGENVMSGVVQKEGKEEAYEMRLRADSGTLYFATDFEQDEMVEYALSEFSSRNLVFENNTVPFPKQVILRREGTNSYAIVYSNPASAKTGPTTLSNKRMVRRMKRLRLQ